MINTIRTRLQELREEAQFRHKLRHNKPTLRANLWTAADLTLGQRPAISTNAMSHYPAPMQQVVPATRTDWERHRTEVLDLLGGRRIQAVW
jgi:hypothetical protein